MTWQTSNGNCSKIKGKVREVVRYITENNLLYFCIAGVVILTVNASTVYAAFDLDKAGGALTEPIKGFIDKYWSVGVLALGIGGAVVAQGDLRAKAIGFGSGVLLSGVIMGAVKLGLGI